MRRSPRLLIALVIAAISVVSYFSSRQENPVTGRKQSIALNQDQEIRLGLQSAFSQSFQNPFKRSGANAV